MIDEAGQHADAALCSAIGDMLDVPFDAMSADSLAASMRSLERQRRRFEAIEQQVLAAATRAGLGGSKGAAGVTDVLVTMLQIDRADARARVRRALDLAPRVSLLGEVLEPSLPATAAAVAAGEISAAQADVVIDTVEDLPPSVPSGAAGIVERVLLEAATVEHPRALKRTAKELLARLDPDGIEPREDLADRKRGFTMARRTDGTSIPRGMWTAELTAAWDAVIDALGAPRPGPDGEPDPRSASQRRHDAMLEAAYRLLRSDLPVTGGAPVTILASTTIAELTEAAKSTGRAGLAALAHGGSISARRLLTMACEASIVPVVFDDAGGILAYGRSERCSPAGQRRALAARDGGCSFPGCERPPAWCQAHHVIPWIRDGLTDLDNLTLLCRYHHRTFEQSGWEVRMRDGTPEWLPPPWLDPQRRPRRNSTTRKPEIEFRQPQSVA